MNKRTHLLRVPSWQLLAIQATLRTQRHPNVNECGDLGHSEYVQEERLREIEAVTARTYGLN
jgi:hypothetical protein